MTPRDVFEIENLLTRYNLGYDNAAIYDFGLLTALSFTSDALFERLGGPTRRGTDGLIDNATQYQSNGGTHHWDANLLLVPDGEAVVGFNYDLLFSVPPRGSPVEMRTSRGTLAHRYVRTESGWLIDFRRYEGADAPEIAWPALASGLTLADLSDDPDDSSRRNSYVSAVDYVAINQLYARAAISFDSGAEEGLAFARSFTADGSLTRNGVTIEGAQAMAALAAANTPFLSTWTSNLVLDPVDGGAIGRVYVLVKNSDGEVVDVGTFHDELVKAADGWRFKRRTYQSELAM